MNAYCPKCCSIHTEDNLEDFVLAPFNETEGVIVTCPYCDGKFLVTVTFFSLNQEDEGEQYDG